MEMIHKQATIDAIVSATSFESEQAIKNFVNDPGNLFIDKWVAGIDDAIHAVQDMNGIDLICCYECKNGVPLTEKLYDCALTNCTHLHEGNWFCADGKHKEGTSKCY